MTGFGEGNTGAAEGAGIAAGGAGGGDPALGVAAGAAADEAAAGGGGTAAGAGPVAGCVDGGCRVSTPGGSWCSSGSVHKNFAGIAWLRAQASRAASLYASGVQSDSASVTLW